MTDNHRHGHADCRELFARLSEYIDDELDRLTCEDIERHIARCAPCQVCMQTLRRTIELCRQSRPRPVPDDFSRRLKQLIDDLPPPAAPQGPDR